MFAKRHNPAPPAPPPVLAVVARDRPAPRLSMVQLSGETDSEVIVALFRTLLVAMVLVSQSAAAWPGSGERNFYIAAACAAVYSLLTTVLLYRGVRVRGRRPLMLALDTVFLAMLVSYHGGVKGGLFGLFYLEVIVGAIWFGAAGAVGAAAFATLCSVVALSLLQLEPKAHLVELQRLMLPHAELLFLAAVLAGYLAEAWRQERRHTDEQRKVLEQFQRQMDMAQELQTLVLPPTLPKVPGVEVGFRARQAAAGVGGDYYDAVAFSDGALGVCIADVSGKSVPGQLRLPLVKYAFRVVAKHFRQPEVVMPQLGKLLYQDLPPEMQVSMSYAVVEPQRDRFKICRAGHPYPLLLVASSGDVRTIEQPGVIFGAVPDAQYKVERVPFLPDDYLVLYTDGAIEAQDRRGRELETGGLARMLAEAAPESAQDLANWLFSELESYEVGAKHDDLTIVVIRRVAL